MGISSNSAGVTAGVLHRRRFQLVAAVVLSLALLGSGFSGVAAQAQGSPTPANGQGELVGVGDDLGPDSLGPDGSLGPVDGAEWAAANVVYPNLGSQLSALAVAAADGGDPAPASPSAAATGPTLPDGTNSTASGEPVLLTIQLDGNRDGVLEFLADNGVTPSNVVGDYLEVYVPPELLGPLASQTGVSRAREMPQPFRSKGLATSQGVGAHGALAWHRAGHTGDGVKVGVIDFATSTTSKDAFTGLRALRGTDLPSTVIGRCYTDVGKPTSDLANCDTPGGNGHGTAVAESLMDVAPDADLYIANPKSWADLDKTVKWMHGEGVKVINYSVGWSFHGAADGTSPVTPSPLNTAKWAADNGIVWVNSAGNYARKFWFGAFADSDSDGYHEWTGSGNTADEAQMFELKAKDTASVFIRWDDTWGGATKDLDLEVKYSATRGGAQQALGSSADVQNGGTTDVPYEGVNLTVNSDGFFWFYVKKKTASSAPSWLQIQVFSNSIPVLDHYTAGGSITSPADSPRVLAAGASDRNGFSIRSWSSRGPTPDGRTKPDIVGTDCATTRTDLRFCGTSQAAPHVAGLAALVLGRNPAFTAQQAVDYLKTNAADRGAAGTDNTWGHGFASLPADAVSDGCTEALAGSGSVQGSWDDTCESQVRNNSYARYYGFSLTQQSSVRIDLDSDPTSRVDTYLFLRSGKNTRSGVALRFNDDYAGKGRDSRIEDSLPAGDYTIEATTFNRNRSGSFTLSVSGIPTQTVVQSGPEVSIAAGPGVTEGDAATFTLSASPAPTTPLTVDVTVSASGDFGATTGSREVTISTSGTGSLSVPTSPDSTDEADGSVTVTVDDGSDYTVSATAGSASVAVADDDLPPPVVSIAAGSGLLLDTDIDEGESASFTLSANPAPASALTVTVDVFQIGDFGATAGSRQVTVPTTGTATFSVATTDDSSDEADGSIRARLMPGQGYAVSQTASQATVVVEDDDDPPPPTPEISIAAGGDISEGGDAVFTLTANPAPAAALDVAVSVAQSGDFGVTAGSRTVTVATSGTGTLTVATTDDSTDEADGSVTAAVADGVDYDVSTTSGSASVAVADDDDPPPPPPACTPQLPSDAVTVGEVTGWRDGHSGAAHVLRWNRVLEALGEDTGTGATAMTAAESEANESLFMYSRWDRVTRTLEALEACGSPPPPPPPEPEISIAAGNSVTEGGSATFTLSASPAPSAALTVDVTVAQQGDFGVAAGSRQVTISTSGTGSLSVATSGDSVDEPDGSVTVAVDGGSGYTVSSTAASASVAVVDDDDPPPPPPVCTPNLPSDAVTVGEVTGWRDGHSGAAHVLRWNRVLEALGTDTGTGAAAMTAAESEDNESLFMFSRWDRVTRTLEALEACDSPPPPPPPEPEISITADGDITEGGDAVFTLTANPAPSSALDVVVSVAQTGDFGVTPGSQTVTIPTSGTATLTVSTSDDSTGEADGSVTAAVADGTGYDVSATAGSATVVVADDDVTAPPSTPVISIAFGGDITEGGDATFTLTASPAPSADLDVTVTVAQSGDFGVTPGSQTVTIGTGGSGTLTVATSDDSVDEADGSVTAAVADGTGYDVSATAGSATVAVADDDDPPPPADSVISIAAGSGITEGGNATFTLTANPAPTAALDVAVSVTQSGDFGVTVGSRTVTISTGGSGTLTVATSDDSTDESDGSVTVSIADGTGYDVSSTAGSASVAVSDDDPAQTRLPPSQVSFTAEDASATEGDTLRFRVMLSNAANARVRVYWRTRYSYAGEHSAYPGRDYPSRARGWLAFEPGEVEKSVYIALPNDTVAEPAEVFQIYLSFTEGGATIADRDATMTIHDND